MKAGRKMSKKSKSNTTNLDYKWFAIKKKYHIYSDRKMQSIQRIYQDPNKFDRAMLANLYQMLIIYLEKPFSLADEIALELQPELKVSAERCKWVIYATLKKNEAEGDTCINANLLGRIVSKDYPYLKEFIVNVVTNDKLFYYNPRTKVIALRNTYEAEVTIADTIKDRIENPIYTPMEWQKYRTVDDFTLTDEQIQLLKTICDKSVVMLSGSAGCVDCDTEFFNGQGWKRIADYTVGDKVLQYNEDGSTNLINPIAYIKKPCDKLWHFETKYGINQTICDEHRIVYWSAKGFKHEGHIDEIINGQNSKGWNGKFNTAFNYTGNGISLTDTEIRIMCAVICDGSFYKVKEGYKCRFHIKKDRKKERLRLLFTEGNINWSEVKSQTEGYSDFYIILPVKTKIFDTDWYNCTHHQLEVICSEIMFWDGHVNKTNNGIIRSRYSTTVKANADFIQFAYSACGYRASISIYNRIGQSYLTNNKKYIRKSIEYNVTVSNQTMVGLCTDNRLNHGKTPIIQVPTIDGYKYCFTVPSHMMVLRRKNCIFITGNCGKTATTKALVKMLKDNNYTMTCVAPTGIAAKRLSQSTGCQATTIHMNLATNMQIGNFLIVDEASMVGVHLCANLLRKVPNETKIIFICDEAQLASISCGNAVQDIIDSNIIPIIKLTKVFRYGIGGIATVATDIRQGQPLTVDMEYNDYRYIPITNEPIKDIMTVYKGLLEKYSPNDIMILSPFNVREAGTFAINKAIQAEYNHNPTILTIKKQNETIEFKVGDRVINTENNYHVQGEYDDMAIMNGDIGTILNYDGSIMTVEFESGIAYLERGDINKLLLAYAISIHKSQGSQSKAVITVVDKSQGFFLTRNLTYVAVSRAEKELILVGDLPTINKAMQIQQEKERETWLKNLLTKP